MKPEDMTMSTLPSTLSPSTLSCQAAGELLPWLLGGSLPGEQQHSIRQHLAGCESCRGELAETAQAWRVLTQHVPSLHLVEYALGLPSSGPQRERIERHLALCPSCQEELALVRADNLADFEEARTAHALSRVRPGFGPARRGHRPARWRVLAIAATLLVAVVSGHLIVNLTERSSGSLPADPPARIGSGAQPSPDGIFTDGFESTDITAWSNDLQ